MEKKKLKEIATVHYGKSPQGIKTNFSDIPIYGTGGCVGFSTISLFEGPLIVIARKGTLNNPIYSPKSCWIIDTAYGVIGKKGIDSKWLYFNFLNFNLSSLNEATGVPSINRNSLYNIQFSIPPLPEQQKIASILTTVDDKISSIEAQIQQTEQLKKGLMAKLLTEGISHTEFKDTEIGRIPKSWEVCSGDKITQLITKGSSPKWQGFEYKDDGILFVTSENVRDGFLDLSVKKFLSSKFNEKQQNSILKNNDILINIVGASIGRACLYYSSYDNANINQAVCLFRLKKNVEPFFILYFLQQPLSVKRLLDTQAGSARQNISLKDLRLFLFALPPLPEQQQIASILSSVDDKLDVLQSKRSAYTTLKKGLMAKLLTGQMRVQI